MNKLGGFRIIALETSIALIGRQLLLLFLVPGICCSQIISTQEIAITGLPAIRAIHRDHVSHQLVEFEGIVTHVDPLRSFLFVQEGAHAIFVFRPNAVQITPGSRVRIRGRLAKGDLNPIVAEPNLTVIGDSGLPDPRIISELDETADCQYITTELEIIQTLTSVDSTTLFAKTANGIDTYIQVQQADGVALPKLSQLAGSRVRCTGTLGLQLENGAFPTPGHKGNRIIGCRLFCGSPTDIEIIENRVIDSDCAEAVSLSVLQNENFPNGRFLTFAQVSMIDYSDSPELVVSDGSSTMRAKIRFPWTVAPGMTMRMGGIKSLDKDGQPQFEVNYLRHLDQAAFPPTTSISIKRAIKTHTPDKRINVEGKPLRIGYYDDGRPYLILSDGEDFVRVSFQDDALESLAAVDPSFASKASITGISLADFPGSEAAFRLVVTRPRDMVLVESKTPLSRMLLVGLGVLLSVCGLAFVWIQLLKRQVSQKTTQAREISAQLISAYDAIEDGLLAFDENMETLAVNQAFCQMMRLDVKVGDSVAGLPEQLHKRLYDAKDFSRKWSEWQCQPNMRGSFEVASKGNTPSNITIDSAPIRSDDGTTIGRILVARDETEKRMLQAEILHSNKLEAVGRLVAGIAHDFNNVLTAVTANVSVVRMKDQATVAAVDKELAIAEEAAFRGAEIVRRLLTFSAKTQFQLEPHSINDIIERLHELVRHTFDASIRFEFEFEPSAPFVNAEATALEQVLLNLYLNAKDAMPSGGKISVSTRVETHAQTGQDVVLVSVEDDGPGVPEEIRHRLFEPYFTTKDSDHGTGLGLSVSYRVVQRHGGLLRYKKGASGGSNFEIHLPLERNRPDVFKAKKDKLAQGSGTVLIVDDEEVIRNVAQAILRRQGYTTICASNGEEALELVTKNADKIDVVLLDLTMPGMSGRDVLKELRNKWPQLPVVICSGYLIEEVSRIDNPDGADGIIAKPYSMSDLVSAVAEATLPPRRQSA